MRPKRTDNPKRITFWLPGELVDWIKGRVKKHNEKAGRGEKLTESDFVKEAIEAKRRGSGLADRLQAKGRKIKSAAAVDRDLS